MTILAANLNKLNISKSKIERDFYELAEFLRGTNIEEVDICYLEKAISDDTGLVDHQGRIHGPGVKQWIKKMIIKAADDAWQIEVGVASVLLVTALNLYYGWLW